MENDNYNYNDDDDDNDEMDDEQQGDNNEHNDSMVDVDDHGSEEVASVGSTPIASTVATNHGGSGRNPPSNNSTTTTTTTIAMITSEQITASRVTPSTHNRMLSPFSPSSSYKTSLSSPSTPTTDQLERCGRWLSSIPRDDVTILRQTLEYEEFLYAFERLGHAHRRVISQNRNDEIPVASLSAFRCPNNRNGFGDHSYFSTPGSLHHRTDLTMADNGRINDVTSNLYNNDVVSSPEQFRDNNTVNYFQKHTDDVVLRILEFLECRSLIRASLTCSRFHQLANKSAVQRTYDVAHARQLNNVMQLLRAQEQIVGDDDYAGVENDHHNYDHNGRGDDNNNNNNNNNNHAIVRQYGCHVPVPMLLPRRRVIVTNAGDPDYNGVYYCTDSNGNGFVFTKPRYTHHNSNTNNNSHNIQQRQRRQRQRRQQQQQQQHQNERREDNNVDGGGGRPQPQINVHHRRGMNVQIHIDNNGGVVVRAVVAADAAAAADNGGQENPRQQQHPNQQQQRPGGGGEGNGGHAFVMVPPRDGQLGGLQQQQQRNNNRLLEVGLLSSTTTSSSAVSYRPEQPPPLRCIIEKRFSNEVRILYYNFSDTNQYYTQKEKDTAVWSKRMLKCFCFFYTHHNALHLSCSAITDVDLAFFELTFSLKMCVPQYSSPFSVFVLYWFGWNVI
jgi:hypothetical protein